MSWKYAIRLQYELNVKFDEEHSKISPRSHRQINENPFPFFISKVTIKIKVLLSDISSYLGLDIKLYKKVINPIDQFPNYNYPIIKVIERQMQSLTVLILNIAHMAGHNHLSRDIKPPVSLK
ncbi:hypothetical protein RF11_04489 [Thelohanellus kitauei]|uniref:Uncharacterized protein n=1 Tax=Thelohanellus kitauei TaxID=669202 RepID=A0A0C2JAY5_THEKT|nr:hypothetical protein RF11_04489 [Thelohanellus kitauei]